MSDDRLPAIEPWPITATVRRFKELSGLGSTSIYELIKSGDIQSVTIGRRRLIVMNSYRALLEHGGRRAKRALGDGSADGSDAGISHKVL